MVKIGPGGSKRGRFIDSVAEHRRQINQQDPKRDVRAPARPTAAQARPLTAAGLSGKLVDQHWPHLGAAAPAAAKLAAAENGLTGHTARTYARVWENAQKILATQLSAVPEAQRADAATRTLTAMARLVDEVGVNAALPAALAAASGLIDAGVRMRARGTLSMTSDDLVRLGEDSTGAVLSLVEGVRDRRGQSSMLNVLPRIVEELQLAHEGLDAEQSRAITAEVARAIAERTPKSGTDLTELAKICAMVSRFARDEAVEPKQILDRAFAEYAATRKAAVEIARGGLDLGGPLDAALGKLLDANAAAPDSLLEAVEALVAAARPYAGQPILEPVAASVSRFADTPVGEALARHLSLHFAQLQQPNALLLFAAAAAEQAARAHAAELIRAHLAAGGQPPDPYEPILRQLQEHSEGSAIQVAIVFGAAVAQGRGTPDLLQALLERAGGGEEDPIGVLQRHADTHHALAAQLANHPVLQGEKKAIAEAVAFTAPGEAGMQRLLEGLSAIKQYLPQAPLERLVGEDKEGRPGLGALSTASGWAQDPLQLLAQLLQDVQPHALGKGDLHEGLARAAIALALQTSGIQNGQALHLPRIREDWAQAAADPNALHYAAKPRGAVDVRAQKSVAGFLDAHPELPIDLAFTAGRHLSPAQISWASDRLANGRGLDAARFLRDTVFALVSTNRLDVLDALMKSQSPPKAISAVLRELASCFQRNDLAQAPIDEIVAGLNAGTDPIAEIRSREAKAAFNGVDLHELAEGEISEEGLAEVMAIQANVADLIVQYSPGFEVWSYDRADVDMTKLLAPFLEALKDTLQGTWPKRKYEDEVGVRQLAACTPEQRAIWRQNTVTMEGDQEVAAAPIDVSIVPLARGLRKALELEVSLDHPRLGALAFDEASRDRLRETRNGLLETLRNAEKGSDEHRAATKEIGPLTDRLRILELVIVLDGLAGQENPAAIGAALKGVAEPAVASLRRLRAKGCAAAAQKLAATIPVASGPKERELAGAYAIDEDGFSAMINSHKTGCLSFGDKRRRWGMCGSLRDANTKILHTFRDGTQKYRTYLRLLPTKFAGYEGPALYIETPVGDTGGGAADLTLLHKGLFAKARAMGVPVLGASQQPPDGWTHQTIATTMTFDWGHTGLYHSDRLSDVKVQGNGGVPAEKQAQLTVSIPPELAARIGG